MREEKYLVKRRRFGGLRWFGGLRFLPLVHPILAAVVCVLVLTISLLGTYAWVTNYVAIQSVTFTTAKLKIELDISKDKTIVRRFASDKSAVEAQLSLIGAPNDRTEFAVNDEVLADWLEEYNGSLTTILMDTDKAAPMSFAFRGYTLTNGSDVPVYFRIARAKLSEQNHEIAFATLCQIEDTDGVSQEGTLISDDEGILYCKEPLYAGDSITVTFVVYLGDIKSGKYTLSSEYAEIIQAASNAVFMAPGWGDVAEELESSSQ